MMYKLTKKELRQKIEALQFSNFDIIIAVTDRGCIIADTISEISNKLWMLASEIEGKINANDTVLLVDDIINSGETIKTVKEKLGIVKAKTFAVAGNADYNIYTKADSVKIKSGLFW